MSMINEFVEKLIDRLGGLKKAESDREDYSDNHDYYDDWEYAFGDGASYGRHYAYGRSIKIIEELAGEYKDIPDTNVGKWIPVSERLPGHYECVLACCNDEFVTIASLNSQEKRWECLTNMSSDTHFPEGEEVIAWQPLPEPYKGE